MAWQNSSLLNSGTSTLRNRSKATAKSASRFLLVAAYFAIANVIALEASAAVDLGLFVTQRNAYVLSAEDDDRVGLGGEIAGSSSGDVGLGKKFFPYGLEANWHMHAYGQTGPLARLRVAPFVSRLRASTTEVEGWDALVQLGHSWTGPALGELTTAFELGIAARRLVSSDENVIFSSGLSGAFWGILLGYGPWSLHTEASLMAFSLGDHGRWGIHRDSNSLRLRASRTLDEESRWRAFAEFFHLHRTFGDARYGFSEGLFVSDVSMSLGASYRF